MPKNLFVAIHTEDGSPLDLLSSTWLESEAAVTGYRVLKLLGPAASRTNMSFTPTVSNSNAVLIHGIGHGTDTQFFAYGGNEVLYDNSANGVPGKEVQGKIVHLLSCSTAHGLDQAFIKAGCVVFIGYTSLVNFGTKDINIDIATADAQIEISLAAGKSVSKAIEEARGSYSKFGLATIGALLVSTPRDSTYTLPGAPQAPAPAGLPQPAVLAENQLPSRSTPTRPF